MARSKPKTRPLTAADLEPVIQIDRRLSGRSRRGFFEKRLRAALDDPKGFIYVGVEDGGALAGFVMARLFEGEFGAAAPVAALDAVGVDPDRLGQGLGRALMASLDQVMKTKGVRELRSQVDWANHSLLRFMDAAGFRLAPRLVLSRPVGEPAEF